MGFGSVSQKIIECGADYHGLDIAQIPVSIVKERLKNLDKKAQFVKVVFLNAHGPIHILILLCQLAVFITLETSSLHLKRLTEF